ncbi:Outer membrane protein assembly factor BamB [Caulifigura coniformis]|uniref:Outer membrane protein assembly factor BamB n=2 Tax=Caulifigura coniformis TaxID=2527983 RepID=A0A517SBX7_9PLAN|nr:Outer membrane protein assembly factor BamB [Caulifigura coniformis]
MGLLTALAVWGPHPASGQVFVDDDLEARRQRREAHSPRIENALLQANAVQKSNPDLALDILQSIFDAPEDSYYETPTGCSVKDAAEAVLLADPETLLKAYERRFESAASGLLEKARRQEGLAARREVVRRYALTAAGRAAMMELAQAACDSGDAATMLRIASRLRRTPDAIQEFEPQLSLMEVWAHREMRNNDAVRARLDDLKQRFPEALVLDGRRVPWFNDDAGRERWLETLLPAMGPSDPPQGLPSWPMAHGDRRRNGVASQTPPFLDTAWKAPLADQFDDIRKYDDPWNDADIKLVNQAAADVEARFRKDGLNPLPVAAPLVTENLAIVAGFGTVKAFDLKTGDLQWSSEPVDQTLAALLAGTDSFLRTPRTQLMQQFVGQRAYRDHVDAALSTDGQRVYHVGHSGLVGLQPNAGALPVSNRGASPLLPRNYNHLQAYDLQGGRCLWSIGGPPRRLDAAFDGPQDEFSFDGAFFHSAPIPWDGQLLCVVEQSRQLRIVAIDPGTNPETAPPLWSQPLLNSDLDLVYSSERRFAGVNVALDGSTLVAALGNGTVIGFDVADRRWLWLTTYADPQPVDYRRMLQVNRIGRSVNDNVNLDVTLDVKEWSDTRTLFAGRNVLVTPADDSRLLCLDRESGKPLWTRPREQAMSLGGVHDEVILLVGKSDIRGLSLKNGETLWTTSIPPASGRGIRMGGRYVLPLSTAEVLTVDITSGAPCARSPLASGEPAGNLAAAGGTLVTQTGSGFRVFRSSGEITNDIKQRLAQNPGDPVALALRGEVKLHAGDITGGEQDLKAINDPPPRIKQVLAWTLVNGLERDFGLYYTPELKLDDLPADAGLRAQAWAAVSKGLQARNDLPGALLAALRGGEGINPLADRLLDRDDSLRVRENRLVRGRLDDLWASMSPEQRGESIDRVRERVRQLDSAAPEYFRLHEMLTDSILPDDLELDYLLRKTLHVALLEQRLLRLRQSEDARVAARANLELLRIATQEPRMRPSALIVGDLTGRLKDVLLDDGKTAGELAQSLLNQPDFLKRQENARTLSGELVATGLDDTSGIFDLPASLGEFGQRSPILQGWSFASDAMQAQLTVTDARGAIMMQERINHAMTGLTPRVSTSGRLALAETADGFRILNVVANETVISATLSSEPFEPFFGGNIAGRVPVNGRRGGSTRPVAPLRPEHLAYIKGAQLLVVDPLTGREHWARTVEPNLDISSDADYIATQDARGRIQVYRASDGRRVREATLPPGGMLYPDYRHDVQRLIRLQEKDAVQVGLFHPATETWTWQRKFPNETRFDVLDGRSLCALEPGGGFVILAEDGHEIVNTRLEAPADLQAMEIFQDGARIYVVAVRFGGVSILSSIPRGPQRPISARLIAVQREDGRTLWARDFDRMVLDPMQPGQWPFLLATAAGEQDEANEERTPSPTWAYLLDRATGKTLHAAELPPTGGSQRGWKIDPVSGAVNLKVGGVGLQVTPRSAPAPAEEVKKPVPNPEGNPAEPPPPPPEAKPGN